MGDNEENGYNAELENLKQKLNESEQRFTAAEEKLNASQTLLTNALAALAAGGHVPPAVVAPTPEETRRDRMTKLYTLLQKSQKLKTTKRVQMNYFANGLIDIRLSSATLAI